LSKHRGGVLKKKTSWQRRLRKNPPSVANQGRSRWKRRGERELGKQKPTEIASRASVASRGEPRRRVGKSNRTLITAGCADPWEPEKCTFEKQRGSKHKKANGLTTGHRAEHRGGSDLPTFVNERKAVALGAAPAIPGGCLMWTKLSARRNRESSKGSSRVAKLTSRTPLACAVGKTGGARPRHKNSADYHGCRLANTTGPHRRSKSGGGRRFAGRPPCVSCFGRDSRIMRRRLGGAAIHQQRRINF